MKNLPFTVARGGGRGGNDCRHVTTMWKRKHAKKHNVSERNGCKCIQFDARASELFPSKPIQKFTSKWNTILCAPKQSQHSIDSFINYTVQYLSSSIWNGESALSSPTLWSFLRIQLKRSIAEHEFFVFKQTQKSIFTSLETSGIEIKTTFDKLKSSTHITNHLSTTSGTTNFILTEQSTNAPPRTQTSSA